MIKFFTPTDMYHPNRLWHAKRIRTYESESWRAQTAHKLLFYQYFKS
jgi:hypothetical protein